MVNNECPKWDEETDLRTRCGQPATVTITTPYGRSAWCERHATEGIKEVIS